MYVFVFLISPTNFIDIFSRVPGLAEWNSPTGGMFLWMRVLGVKDSAAIVDKALDRKLILVSGTFFTPTNEISAYIRISFASVTQEQCDEVCDWSV
jgi:DNA-binding transcriptional MocR family regulator